MPQKKKDDLLDWWNEYVIPASSTLILLILCLLLCSYTRRVFSEAFKQARRAAELEEGPESLADQMMRRALDRSGETKAESSNDEGNE
jgi:hypothetical protein